MTVKEGKKNEKSPPSISSVRLLLLVLLLLLGLLLPFPFLLETFKPELLLTRIVLLLLLGLVLLLPFPFLLFSTDEVATLLEGIPPLLEPLLEFTALLALLLAALEAGNVRSFPDHLELPPAEQGVIQKRLVRHPLLVLELHILETFGAAGVFVDHDGDPVDPPTRLKVFLEFLGR